MGVDAMTLYRLARRLRARRIPLLPAVLRKAIYYLHSSYVPDEAEIGEGTQLGYGGIGVVIHKAARIGRHCLISQQVTIGGRSGIEGAPVIGDYVRVGAGAKILGNIHVGDFAVIGANAVVLKDVAPGMVVAGIPARVIRQDPDPLTTYQREMGLLPRRAPLSPVPPAASIPR
ncbi:serine acetyltransferase [Myxococcus sp. K15C18031901]|uniref:serine O-acetyltransferase n=1 Tax=Myxococcus dinghuensis TaxID=2906761 RepID=UPI0020A70F80|nr:serine acetyltransferase [Myxococcus dinghuensis]MCP3103407.1 serine acetyltransferase [Myxococcus dinghuensis]